RWNPLFEVEQVEQLALIACLPPHHHPTPSPTRHSRRNHSSPITTSPFSTASTRSGRHTRALHRCCPPAAVCVRSSHGGGLADAVPHRHRLHGRGWLLALTGANEEGTLASIKALPREAIEPALAAHRGRLVKT